MAGKQWGELLANAEAGPEPIPDGIYDFQVHSAKVQQAKTGAPMIVAVLKVISGPYAGKTVWNNFVLTDDNPNALGYFFKHMQCMGIDQGVIANLPPPEQGGLEQLAQMILGKYLTASIGHRLFQGATKNQVGDIRPFAGQPQGQGQVPQQFQPQPQPAPQFAQQQGQPQQPYQQPQYVQPQQAPQPQPWQPQQPQQAPAAYPPAQVQPQYQQPQPAQVAQQGFPQAPQQYQPEGQVVQFPPQEQAQQPSAPPPPPF